LFLLIGTVSLVLASSLSNGSFDSIMTPTAKANFAVDPTFKEFYQTLGGRDILGQPLTGLFEQDDKKCQYTEVALMCYDEVEPDVSRRFSLAPLGDQLEVREKPQYPSNPEVSGRELGGGFVLFNEFTGLYDRIYGALYAGRPLTQVRVNHSLQRYEQFFENVGFYRNFQDKTGDAHMMTYGAYLCGPDCSSHLNEYWQIIQSGLIPQPFEMSVERLGWNDLGSPLTRPVVAKDGNLEQVYDNVVLYAPTDDLSQVRFRPIVIEMNVVEPQPPVERNPHVQLVFYETEPGTGLGHNVPLFFDEFIANHGGMDLSGMPITEIFAQKDGHTFRQCFENYCLDYDPGASITVRMAPLGIQYAAESEPGEILRRAFSPETVELKIEESRPILGKNEEQHLAIHVFQRETSEPMYLVESDITVNLPDGTSKTYHLKPTDRDGSATMVLPPLKDMPNMSVVEYQACLNLPGDPKICATDSFIYQNN
jgi:hypothetical protein